MMMMMIGGPQHGPWRGQPCGAVAPQTTPTKTLSESSPVQVDRTTQLMCRKTELPAQCRWTRWFCICITPQPVVKLFYIACVVLVLVVSCICLPGCRVWCLMFMQWSLFSEVAGFIQFGAFTIYMYYMLYCVHVILYTVRCIYMPTRSWTTYDQSPWHTS